MGKAPTKVLAPAVSVAWEVGLRKLSYMLGAVLYKNSEFLTAIYSHRKWVGTTLGGLSEVVL